MPTNTTICEAKELVCRLTGYLEAAINGNGIRELGRSGNVGQHYKPKIITHEHRAIM